MSLLALLQRVVDERLTGVEARTIKRSASPARVERLRLAYAGPPGPSTLILKRISPDWPGDPAGHRRESTFYRSIAPRLDLPRPCLYYAGPAPEGAEQWVLMADLAATHRFPDPTRAWRQAEARTILSTYAQLHARGRPLLPPPEGRDWLFPRYETRVRRRAEALPAMVERIVAAGRWRPLPGLPGLVERTLAGMARWSDRPPTLLHNDVYPPNAALPHDGTGAVVLVDWEMVGWGHPEMDLAFLFCQPYRADRRLDRARLQEHYWRTRARLEGSDPDPERHALQRHADALLALWLIPVAHQVTREPHPAGSPSATYWESMFDVLEQRLRELGDGT